MYTNIEGITAKYDKRIAELLEQIAEFKAEIQQYKNLLDDKEYHINLLYKENQELKAQIQNLQQTEPISTPYAPNQPINQQTSIAKPTYSSQITHSTQFSPLPPPPSQNIVTSQPTSAPVSQPVPQPLTAAPTNPSFQSTTMKRLCPNCGASGFAVKEIEDKSRILSYVPRRIYAKMKHCTKCGYEW